MRFRFCGDLDCPDWVLAEIQTLSRLTSVKFKLLASHVTCSLADDAALDGEKTARLTGDARFDRDDVEAAVAALRFVLSSAAKHGVAAEELVDETQQLGLPKEHAVALGKVVGDRGEAMRRRLAEKSLKLNSLEKVDWRVDYVLSSSVEPEARRPEVHLRLEVRDADSAKVTPLGFSLDPEQCRLLLRELQQAERIMSEVCGEAAQGEAGR